MSNLERLIIGLIFSTLFAIPSYNLKTVDWSIIESKEIVPKIGTNIEKRILNKLKKKSNGKTIEEFVKNKGVTIWYHNAPQYWIHSHTEDYVPKVEYYEGYKENKDESKKIPYNLKETKISAQYKSVIFDSDSSVIINGLLNSSLFYWWYLIWSDGRHLLLQHINNFPININSFPLDLKERVSPLVNSLMKKYDHTSNYKTNLRSGGYVIRIKEIIPSKSRNIIYKIDEVLSDYFQFNDDEKNFIKNFDLEFRI